MGVQPGAVYPGVSYCHMEDLNSQEQVEVGLAPTPRPYPYYEFGNESITIEVTDILSEITGQDPYWTVAVVGDMTDVNGDLTAAIDYVDLGQTSSLTDGDQFTLSTGLSKAGTYRLVTGMGTSQANARNINNVDTSSTSTEYHVDSDNNNALGGAVTIEPNGGSEDDYRECAAGVLRRRAVVDAITPSTTSAGYTDNPTVSVSMEPEGATGAGFVNPKAVTVAANPANASVAKTVEATIDANGDGTSASFPVDTDWPEAAQGVDLTVECGDVFGDQIPPASQEADIFSVTNPNGGSSNIIVPAEERGWISFATSGSFTNSEMVQVYADPLHDSSGNGQHFTDVAKEASFTNYNESWPARQGTWDKFGQGLTFKSGGDNISYFRETTVLDITGDLSATCVLRPESWNGDQAIFTAKGAGSSESLYEVGISNNYDGNIRFYYHHEDSSGNSILKWGSTILSNGTDYRLTLRRDVANNTVQVYLNDTLEIDASYTGDPISPTTVYFILNNVDYSEGYDLYELRVWSGLIAQSTLDTIVDPNDSTYKQTAEGTEAGFFQFGDDTSATPQYAQGVRNPSSNSGMQAGHAVDVGTLSTSSPNGAGTGVYNRGEQYDASISFVNVFGTAITPSSTTLRVHAADDTLEHEEAAQNADANGEYALSYTSAATDSAPWDTIGEDKHLAVAFGHYGAKDPMFDYSGGTGANDRAKTKLYSLSRKWEWSTDGTGIVTNSVYTAKSASPSSDAVTSFNRGADTYFDGYLYNVRGELLGSETVEWGVRPEDQHETRTTADDSSGNGHTLTLVGDNQPRHTRHDKYRMGRDHGPTTPSYTSQDDAAFALTGEMAATLSVTLDSLNTSQVLLSHGASGETQADNALYSVGLTSDNKVVYRHEYGAGTDVTAYSRSTVQETGAHTLTLRRVVDADGNLQVTIKVDGATYIDTAFGHHPDGGSNGTLYLGQSHEGGKYHDGGLFEARIWSTAPSQATLDTIADPDARGAANYEQTAEGTEVGLWFIDRPYENGLNSFTLSSGHFSGSAAQFAIPVAALVEGRQLVAASTATVSGQPQSGTGGTGNFAGTAKTEFSVTDQYTLTARTQREPSRNTDPEDTTFTIGENVIYTYAKVVDAAGDPVAGAEVTLEQESPRATIRQTEAEDSASDGWTEGVPFTARAPKGSGWTQHVTVRDHFGNTGTASQAITTLSAFAANKVPLLTVEPVTGVANTATGETLDERGHRVIPGDRWRVKLALLEDGARVAPDTSPTPALMLLSYNDSTDKVEVLQSDGTWLDKGDTGYSEHFFDFATTSETDSAGDPLNYLSDFGTSGQGVSSTNGYTLDTSTWPERTYGIIARYNLDKQTFYQRHSFVVGHRTTHADLGHLFDGTDFATGFPSK